MKKFILDLFVKQNKTLNSQYFLLILTSSEPLPKILPGQFVEVRVDHSPETFLRRPISVNFVNYQKNEIWLLIQKVGSGTSQLSELKSKDYLNVVLPLGNSFSYPQNTHPKVLLIGGGVGIAPLLYWGSVLKQKNISCSFLLGGRSVENILQLTDFQKYGEVFITTDDGTMGEKGLVTQHSVLQSTRVDAIYCCGPTPMMKAVAQYAKERKIYCEVSLENTMACGIGACLCCVTETTNGNECVCTQGPIFEINKLKWQI